MTEEEFTIVIHKIIGMYTLSPEAAAKLLQRILTTLRKHPDDTA